MTRVAEAWPAILNDVASGAIIKTALAARGLTYGQVYAYVQSAPCARKQWEDAREESAGAFMDEALDVVRSKTDDASHARTRVDTLKWAARIRNPRQYSDKSQVDVNVRTVDLTRIISDAQARLTAQRQSINHSSGAQIEHAHAQSADEAMLAAVDRALPGALTSLL